MWLQEVETYLDLLRERLKTLQVDGVFQNKLIFSVQLRMYSLLKHWNDIPFRRGILAVGLEEGLYYEPDAKLETKCFVVVCIRNSYIETLQSESFADAGLTEALSVEKFKSITMHAISYFKRLDFEALCRCLARETIEDYYGAIVAAHPVTWAVLCRLWTSANKRTYPPLPCEPYQIPGMLALAGLETQELNPPKVILDAMDITIDDTLLRILSAVQADKLDVFYISCFKHLSRNFEKLMHVMEFCLTRGCLVVTNNYFLENGYIEKRKELLRAAHDVEETKNQLRIKAKPGSQHEKALNHMLGYL
jgi:hypothetical protein